ncbi:FMP42 [Symbiodinium sp. KB8]|nr:FMP42 [Symbiodinium sp. KB8]
MGSESRPRTLHRDALVAVTFLGVLLCSGAIYGFAAFELMLKKEGLFVRGTGPDGDPTYDAAKFNLIISVASAVLAGGSTFVGVTLDLGGPQLSVRRQLPESPAEIVRLLHATGSILIALASVERSFMYNIGFALLGYAGAGDALRGSCARAAFVYPQYISLIISLNCCLFDSSSVVFPVMQALYHAGVSLRVMMLVYTGVGVVLFGAAIVLWGVERAALEAEAGKGSPDPTPTPSDGGEEGGSDLEAQLLDKSPGGTPVPVSARSFRQQLCTVEFGFAFAMCIVCMWRSNLFLGLANDFLASLGDAQHGDVVTTTVAWVIPAGVVFVPVAAWLLDNMGLVVSGYTTFGLGLAYGILTCIPNLWLQVGTAVLFTMYRALFYSYLSTYTAKVFGMATVGRLTGILYTSTAIFIPFSILIDQAVQDQLHGNFLPVNIAMTAMLAIPILASLAMTWVTQEPALKWPLGEIPLLTAPQQGEEYTAVPQRKDSSIQ